ncbi:MAG: type I-E CRISPR-associated protein Cas6/Cse3/CasE [Ectothiorhodospiraceae bacterium]|nr:type I-E CRISPR-associated protein Cas6/Cse3/CasE [Ectothiorhodospiraceae bacterium]
MYYSYLIIDTGGNPDRPRPGRNWIKDVYAVHRRLCMGFPSDQKRQSDPQFLDEFDMVGFTSNSRRPDLHNDTPRGKSNRPNFLFRIENTIRGNETQAAIVVRSEKPPDWEYAFCNARTLLANVPIMEPRVYNPEFRVGQKLQYRIRMNLSKKSKLVAAENGEKNELSKPKRMAFTWEPDRSRDEQIQDWFVMKTAGKGLNVLSCEVEQIGWVRGWKPEARQKVNGNFEKHRHRLQYRSAMLNGTLEVTNPEEFHTALTAGIGSAKAFGFGLLSVREV